MSDSIPPFDDVYGEAFGKAIEIAINASKAKGGVDVRDHAPCPLCGGVFDFHAAVPARKKTFLLIRCRTKGCLHLIT
jgi:hypothetical protein